MKRCLWVEIIEDPDWGGDMPICLLLSRVNNRIVECEKQGEERYCSRYSEFDDGEEEDD